MVVKTERQMEEERDGQIKTLKVREKVQKEVHFMMVIYNEQICI